MRGILVAMVLLVATAANARDIPDLTHLEACNHGSETVYAFNASGGQEGYVSQTLS